ncbi:MAG: ATP synthase F1 subunit delta [Bacteroidetes bacterium]|nr:ATP synthase F1 subunit delta [Bacteroidota bacterium]HET6245719.1 ATP synthase F1 subunit delta [Bacteroidia bacterium]
MKGTIVASRYAKSLLDLSLEQGNSEQVKKDMQFVVSLCTENRDFSNFIKNPIVKTDKKIAVFKEVFQEKISNLSQAFIELLCKKRREQFVQDIAKEFLKQYNTHKKIMTAVITSASGIDENIRQRVLQMISDSSKWEVELVEKVNPDFIGGFTLQFADKRIDTTLLHKLEKLKREFKENPYIKNF